MIPAYPKPGQVKKPKVPVKVFPDGREVCDLKTKAGHDEYRARVRAMLTRQNGKCGLMITPQCKMKQGKLSFEYATFDHSNGRGAKGAKRDDRIFIKGVEQNMAVCPWCNSAKGSRPLSDFLTEAVP
jgi:hypothetical protein